MVSNLDLLCLFSCRR